MDERAREDDVKNPTGLGNFLKVVWRAVNKQGGSKEWEKVRCLERVNKREDGQIKDIR